MRYFLPVYFLHVKGELNPATGNHEETIISEKLKRADVTDSATDVLKIVYGDLKQGSLTIRLQRPYTEPFNRIRVGEKLYRVDWARHNCVFVVSEV